MARLVDLGGEPANRHEREVVGRLERELPAQWTLIPNVSLPDSRTGHVYEYDIIVIAPHGVYVCELKMWAHRIREINRTTWQLKSGKTVRNPLVLTDNKARILKSLIIGADLQGRAPYVQACFICGNDETELDIYGADGRRSLLPGEAAAYLRDPNRLDRWSGDGLSKRDRFAIEKAITGPMRPRDAERVYGNYLCTDLQEHDDESGTWLARHAHLDDGRTYRVRTWYLSPYHYDDAALTERRRILKRTAQALSRIGDHPNIATLRDFGEQEGEFYEVTDWSDAGTLSDAYVRGVLDRLPAEARMGLVRDIGQGLAAAMDAGVIHRGLCPEAILLTPDGRARLFDFDRAFIDATSIGTVAGAVAPRSTAWLAPEVLEEDGELWDSTDLYSLGRIALEMLARDLPAAVRSLLEQCASKDHLVRPDNPAAFLDALEAATDSGGVAAPERAADPPPAEMPSAPEPSPEAHKAVFEEGDVIDGSNTVVEVLAAGASSTVYAVINEPLGQAFALKLIEEAPEDYDPREEFHLLHGLSSEHVLHAHWTGRTRDGRTYLLLDYVEGPTLREHLDAIDDEPLPVDEALQVIDEVLDGLEAVAAAGAVHRDVKPENILLASEGAVLVDFSSARSVDRAGNAPVGTLKYTPPDLGEAGWSPAADTFAAACVLFEMLGGRPPWGERAPSTEHAPTILTSLRKDVPAQIAKVVQRAVSPSAELRFDRPSGLREALRQAAAAERADANQPRRITHVGQVLEEAGKKLWSIGQVQALVRHADLLVPLAAALDDCTELAAEETPEALQAALIASEARLHAFELPLPDAMPSVYDVLVEGRPPADRSASDDAEPTAAKRSMDEGDRVFGLGGLHPSEAAYVVDRLRAGGRKVDRFAAASAAVDPEAEGAAARALESLFTSLAAPMSATADNLDTFIDAGVRVIALQLPVGHRGRAPLGALLTRRRAMLDRILDAALADQGRTWIAACWGCVYLGSGLRVDVGDGLDAARGDTVRATWSNAFQGRRCVASTASLRARVRRPTRTADGLMMPVGRLAWPDAPDGPWLHVGGLSLPERVLPILRVEPESDHVR